MPIGEIFALTAALCWAVGSLLFGRIGKSVSPAAMNAMKCLSAAVMLTSARLALAPSIGPLHGSARSALWLAASAVVGLTIGDTAYFEAIGAIGVPRAILLLSAAPVFAAIGGALALGERITARAAAGIAITLSAIALAVTAQSTGDDPPLERRGDPRAGIAFGLLAALCQAAGSLMSRHAMGDGIDPLAAAAARVSVGALALGASALVSRRARGWSVELRADRAWAKIAAASLVGTFAGIWMAQIALARAASAGVATTLLATSPIFALPLAHVLGHERARARGALATLVAVAGVALLTAR